MNKNICFLCFAVNKQSFVYINDKFRTIIRSIYGQSSEFEVNSDLHCLCLMCSNILHECYQLRHLAQCKTLPNMCQGAKGEKIQNIFEEISSSTKLTVSDIVSVAIEAVGTEATVHKEEEEETGGDDWYQVDVQYFVEYIGKRTIKREHVSADELRADDNVPPGVLAANSYQGHNETTFAAIKSKDQDSTNGGTNNNYTSTKYSCDICPYAASRESTLNNHLLLHGNVKNTKYFVCKYCPYVSKQKANVLLHEMEHTGDKPYRCGVCARTFARGDDFRRHGRTHSGDRPYRCDVCHKTFSRSCNFITHQRSHTGIRPYACRVCDKRFARGNDLTRHAITHICKKPYECDVCGQKFSRGSNLKIHQRCHTGEQPYGCDTCGQRFTQTNMLKRHKRACGQGRQ